MQNKRTKRLANYRGRGIIQTHISNNLKNYVIVTIIFLIRSNTWSIIYK